MGIKKSDTAVTLQRTLEETSEEVANLFQLYTESSEKVEHDASTLVDQINQQKESLIRDINMAAQSYINVVVDSKEPIACVIKSKILKLSNVFHKITTWKKWIELAAVYGSEKHILVEIERMNQILPSTQNELSSYRRDLTENKQIELFNSKLNDVSCQIVKRQSYARMSKLNDGRVLLLQKFSVSSNRVSGIFLDEDIIFVAYRQCQIIVCDFTGLIKDSLSISSYASDITRIDDQAFAVATNSKEIHIIITNPLQQISCINSMEPIYGLSFNSGSFVCAYLGCISWIDSNTGYLLKKEASSCSLHFIRSTGQNGYVSVGGKRESTCKSVGQKSFIYKNTNLGSAFSVDTDSFGNIYIASSSPNSIHQLSPNGELKRIMTLGLCLNLGLFDSNRTAVYSY